MFSKEKIAAEKAQPGLEIFQLEFLADRVEEVSSILLKFDESLTVSEIKDLAHKWKGFSEPYGFPTLKKIAVDIESLKSDLIFDYRPHLNLAMQYLEIKGQVL